MCGGYCCGAGVGPSSARHIIGPTSSHQDMKGMVGHVFFRVSGKAASGLKVEQWVWQRESARARGQACACEAVGVVQP